MKNNAKAMLRQNGIFYLTGLLFILGIKLFYSKASVPDLKWILAPTSLWVRILSGIPFDYEPGSGYVSHSFRFIIAPSCSGVQFMLIAAATLLYSFVHRMPTRKKRNMLDHTQLPYFLHLHDPGKRPSDRPLHLSAPGPSAEYVGQRMDDSGKAPYDNRGRRIFHRPLYPIQTGRKPCRPDSGKA